MKKVVVSNMVTLDESCIKAVEYRYLGMFRYRCKCV